MSMTLTLALAGVSAILIAGLCAFLWRRRRDLRAVGDYFAIAPFLITPAARIRLRAAPLATGPDSLDDEHGRAMIAMRAMLAQLHGQGFVQLGAFASDDDGRIMVASEHARSGAVAQAIYIPGAPPFLECLSLSPARHVTVVSGSADAQALELPWLSVVAKPGFCPAEALTAMAGAPGRPLDRNTFVMLAERAHAARMDSMLAVQPGEAEMLAHGARRGGGILNEQQRARALDMNRDSWADAVRIALLDNGRRKLKLDGAAWMRLEEELVVVHEAMTADEAIAAMAEHPEAGKYGERFKQQNFTPVQIFEKINRRVGASDQRQVAVGIRSPVRARLLARGSALRAAGIPVQGAGA